MKYCIAVQETLRREIVVEADSLEDALDRVENEYDKQNIILTADDACVEPDIFEVDWYSEKDIEEMEENYDIRSGSAFAQNTDGGCTVQEGQGAGQTGQGRF